MSMSITAYNPLENTAITLGGFSSQNDEYKQEGQRSSTSLAVMPVDSVHLSSEAQQHLRGSAHGQNSTEQISAGQSSTDAVSISQVGLNQTQTDSFAALIDNFTAQNTSSSNGTSAITQAYTGQDYTGYTAQGFGIIPLSSDTLTASISSTSAISSVSSVSATTSFGTLGNSLSLTSAMEITPYTLNTSYSVGSSSVSIDTSKVLAAYQSQQDSFLAASSLAPWGTGISMQV